MSDLSDGVREVLAEQGAEAGELRVSPIPGGASRETWLVEGETGQWVLRRDPKGSVSLVAMREEFDLIRAAADAGVPVPEPLAFEPEGGRFSSPGMLMAH